MSALHRLKAKIAETLQKPFEGSEGGSGRGVSESEADKSPFDGLAGAPGRGIFENDAAQQPSFQKIPLHDHPSKPSKVFLAQIDPYRCFVCGIHETSEKPLVSFLCDRPGGHHWLHGACWPEHVRRSAVGRLSNPQEAMQ